MSVALFPELPGRAPEIERERLDKVVIFENPGGTEQTVSLASRPRYRYRLRYNFLRSTLAWLEAQELATLIAAHGGPADRFLFRDPDDYQATDQLFGVGNGSTMPFQLQRTLGGYQRDRLGKWPVYGVVRTNDLLRSEEFENAAWTPRATHAVTADRAVAPDGTISADLVTATAGTGNAGVYQDVAGANGQWTFSVWLRAGTLASGKICVKDNATDTVRGTLDVTMTSAWQRFSVTGTTAGGTTGVRVEFNGVGSGTFYAWGAQVEAQPSARRYIKSVATAGQHVPALWPAVGDGYEPVVEIAGDLVVKKAGVEQVPGQDFSLSSEGVVSFVSAPASGVALTWSGTHYKRMRLEDAESSVAHILSDVLEGEIRLITVL